MEKEESMKLKITELYLTQAKYCLLVTNIKYSCPHICHVFAY